MGRCGCCVKANQFCDFMLFTPIQKYALYESGQIKLDSDFYDTRYILPYPFLYDYSFFSDVETSVCTGEFKPKITGIYHDLCSCNSTYYPNNLTINKANQSANIINDNFNYIGYSYKKYNSPYRSTCASVRSDYDRRAYSTNNNYINNDGISIINFTSAYESLSRIISYIDSSGLHSSGNPNPDETIDSKYYLYIQNNAYAVSQFIRASGEQKDRFLGNEDIINATMKVCNDKAYSSANAFIEPKESPLPWENGCSLQMSGGYFTSDIEFLNPINANLAKISSLTGIREVNTLKINYPLYYKVIPPDDPEEVILKSRAVSVTAGAAVYSSAQAIPRENMSSFNSTEPYCNVQRVGGKAMTVAKKFESFKFEKSYNTKISPNSKYYKGLVLDDYSAQTVEFTYSVDAPDLAEFNNLLSYSNMFPGSKILKPIIPIGYSFKLIFDVGFNFGGGELGRSFLIIKDGSPSSNSPTYFDSCGNQYINPTAKTGPAFCNNFLAGNIDPSIKEFKQNMKSPLSFYSSIRNSQPGWINRIDGRPDINLNDGNLYAYYQVTFDYGARAYGTSVYANPYPEIPIGSGPPLCFPSPQGVEGYSQTSVWSAMVNLVVMGLPTGYDWLDPFVPGKKGRCYGKDGRCINSACPDIDQPPHINTYIYDSAICYGTLNIGVALS